MSPEPDPLTSDDVLDDLRRFVAAKGLFLSPSLENVLVHVERIAEELDRDPYPSFFVLGLLAQSERFRAAVRALRGDPDEGARVVREDIEEYPDAEPYRAGVLYSHGLDRDLWDRTILIDRTIERALADDRNELLDTDFANALIDHQLKLLRKEGGAGNWLDRGLQSPYLMLAHVANTFDESLAVSVRDVARLLRSERPDYSLSNVPEPLQPSVRAFLDDHPDPRRTGFVMMEFGQTLLHDEIVDAIRNTLASFNLKALRADDQAYADSLGANVKTYLHGCGFGIAVFERLKSEAVNPNVMYEAGYMHALRKNVCLLKDATLTHLSSDLVGEIYLPFDVQSPRESVYQQLSTWLVAKKIASP